MARIRDARGRRSVLLSSMPLRSRLGGDGLRPVSLDLVGAGRGEMRPENPVTPVRIATDPREGFTIGPDPDHLVTIMPLGIDPTAPDATVFAGQMLFANARPSIDLLVRPSVEGVQTFEQLVGPSAPEWFDYRLQLTAGQTAALDDGARTLSLTTNSALTTSALEEAHNPHCDDRNKHLGPYIGTNQSLPERLGAATMAACVLACSSNAATAMRPAIRENPHQAAGFRWLDRGIIDTTSVGGTSSLRSSPCSRSTNAT
jgi:hypothetical protein